MTNIELIIRNLVIKLSNLDPIDYKSEMRLGNDFGIDSLDMIELIMTCEREFGIIIHDNEVALHDSAGDLISLVKSKISKKNVA